MLPLSSLYTTVALSFAPAVASPALAEGDDGAVVPAKPRRGALDPLSEMLLHPRDYEVRDPAFASLAPESVSFENAGGSRLRGLWYESASSDRTVIVCMGNTGNATWMVPFAAILVGGGFDVLLFDYQGFGGSDGTGSLLTLPGDAEAAWRFVTETKGRKPEQVGVLGISLGSVLALQLAAQFQPRACAVEDLFFPDAQLDRLAGDEVSAAERLAMTAVRALGQLKMKSGSKPRPHMP